MANTLKFGNGEWYGKKDTILAYNDLNSNYKPLPFNFSRASKATVINKDGLIEEVGSGQPRIDYKDNSKGALLLEPSRSNLVTYSEDFSVTPLSSNDILYTSNTTETLSPSGDNTSDKFEVTASNSDANRRFTRSISVQSFTLSVYVKGESGQKFQLFLARDGYAEILDIDTTLSGEWERIVLSGSFSTSSTSVVIGFEFGFGSSDSVAGNVYYLWGAQLEEGSYATSYIPTSGSAVTRIADECSQTPPDGVIGQTEGTMFFEGVIYGENSSVNRRIFSISNGTSTTCINIQTPATNSKIEFEVTNGGTTQVFISADNNSLVYGQNFKAAFAYKSNDFVAYINGVQIGTDTNGTVPTCNKISFDRGNDTSNFEGSVNDTKLYNTRLSNSELQALTQV